MKTDWPLTEKEVETYRTLYYDHYKTLSKQGIQREEIKSQMQPVLDMHDWSFARFEDYISIYMFQRLVFEHAHTYVKEGISTDIMTSKPEYHVYDPNFGALRLKDNERSEDPDKNYLN